MGGWFGGAFVAMQVVGEMHGRLEYRLLADDGHEDTQDVAAPVQATASWRQSLARALIALSDRIAPATQPAAPAKRPGLCPC